MLAHILALAVVILGGVALYGAGRSDGYRAGLRDAETDATPEVYDPHKKTKKGDSHGDAYRVFRP